MDLNYLSERKLRQLTGCSFKTIAALEFRLNQCLQNKLGRPFKYPVKTLLIATLIKLRSDLVYRSLEIILKIPFVTLSRYTNKVCELLAKDLPGAKVI